MNSQPEPVAVPIATNFCSEESIRPAASGDSGKSAPETFSPDWHPQLGAGLSGFPRYVPLHLPEAGRLDEVICWPDFATFVEDPESRQMMYYPAEESAISVRVSFRTRDGRWQLFAYLDADLLSVRK